MDKKTDISDKNIIINFDFASLYPSSFKIKLSSKESKQIEILSKNVLIVMILYGLRSNQL